MNKENLFLENIVSPLLCLLEWVFNFLLKEVCVGMKMGLLLFEHFLLLAEIFQKAIDDYTVQIWVY